MNRNTLAAHALLTIAIVAGIVGMGIVFNGALDGDFHEISFGIPPLLIGLWWAGRELGRSQMAVRQHRDGKPRGGERPSR